MQTLAWTRGELSSTAERGWLSTWIEQLTGQGHFSWSVDTFDASDHDVLMNVVGGAEVSLSAAMRERGKPCSSSTRGATGHSDGRLNPTMITDRLRPHPSFPHRHTI